MFSSTQPVSLEYLPDHLVSQAARSRRASGRSRRSYSQRSSCRRLARHKNVHFHFTPTHASWLNQVEVWFSILSAKALAGTSFTSPRQVRDQIDAFIKAYNQTAHPFEWTKQVVFSQHPRAKYADLCN